MINACLIKNLKIELHPDKSKIIKLNQGISLLGYGVFYHYRLLRKSNKIKFCRNFNEKLKLYKEGRLDYEDFINGLQGWFGYAIWADTYKLRTNIIKLIDNSLKNKKQIII